MATSSPQLRTRWMSPGGAKPLTWPAVFTFAPTSASQRPPVPEGIDLLVLGTLQHAEDAPRHMVMERSHLAGPPDESAYRERAVGLGVHHMADISIEQAHGSAARPGTVLAGWPRGPADAARQCVAVLPRVLRHTGKEHDRAGRHAGERRPRPARHDRQADPGPSSGQPGRLHGRGLAAGLPGGGDPVL